MAFQFTAASKTSVKPSRKKNEVEVELSSDDYIFSQASIVSSVHIEPGTHYIHPITQKFVNNNGDCFSNESIKANYKSFIGAYNYVNHVQVPNKAIGFIADAVLRRLIPEKEHPDIPIHYVDILIATHRDNKKMVDMILKDQVKYLSMGCDAYISTCSKCGNQFSEDHELCDCLANDKNKHYVDEHGNRRIIAEILGTEKPRTVEYVEASYLTEVPAFHGAVKRSVLRIESGVSVGFSIPEEYFQKPAVQKYLKGK
ncbi:MAG: hypothetical protein WC511_02650 [Candidatus Pacearchaeota archaeon]